MGRHRNRGTSTGRGRWLAAAALGGLVVGATAWRLRRASTEDFRWYRLVYRGAYRLGLAVWQRDVPPPELIDLVEGPSSLPPGRALDLGCGTGTDTVYLSRHGWDVTGVDMVPKAIARARRRAEAAGVTPRLVNGDATRLGELGIAGGFELILDFGCFHTLPEDRRPAYVEGVSEVSAPGATMLLYGFTRAPKAAPVHAAISTSEVQDRFSRWWELVSSQRVSVGDVEVSPRWVDELFELWSFRLRRR